MTDHLNEKEIEEGKVLMAELNKVLEGKEEELVINTLLCMLINATINMGVPPITVVLAVANGFDLALSKRKFRPEILN